MLPSIQKKPNHKNLVVLEGEANETSLWTEIKVRNKNIQRRSYHSTVIFNDSIYVYGGYDFNAGIMSDFHCASLIKNPTEWQALLPNEVSVDSYPNKRYAHSAVVHDKEMIVFGGKISCLGSTNGLHWYDFEEKTWSSKQVKGAVPEIDSHSACIYQGSQNLIVGNMIVYGGFLSGTIGKYSSSLFSLNLESLEWTEITVTGKLQPPPRANTAMVTLDQNLMIFGGSDLNIKFRDLWKFNLQDKTWQQLNTEQQTPESRDGHSLSLHGSNLILFGGIHDITHEKNDIVVFADGRWRSVEENNNEVEFQSDQNDLTVSFHHKKIEQHNPTDFGKNKKYRQLKEANYNNHSTFEFHTQKQQKSKMDIRKHHLLKQFELTAEEKQKYRNHSPTLESLKTSITSINSNNPFRKFTTNEQQLVNLKKLNQKKRPCARDGHSACVHNDKLIIFGGDRHLMGFNDMFMLDLTKLLSQINGQR